MSSTGWTVVTGPCTLEDSGCIQSPNYPSNYEANQQCQISTVSSFWVDKVIIANHFRTEGCCDKLTINGVQYFGSGVNSPDNVVPVGTILWESDRSTHESGWELCPQDARTSDDAASQGNRRRRTGGSSSSSDDSEGGGMMIGVVLTVVLLMGCFGFAAFIFMRRKAGSASRPPPAAAPPPAMKMPIVTPATATATPMPSVAVGASASSSLSVPMKAMSPTVSQEGDAQALTAIGKNMKKRLSEDRANVTVPPNEKTYPSYWKSQSGSFFEFEEVSKDIEAKVQTLVDNTFKPVQTRDRRSGTMPKRFVVKDVKRIENSELWRRYTQGRYGIKSKRAHRCTPVSKIGGEVLSSKEAPKLGIPLAHDVNEEIFFHGTSPAGALGIGKDGLKLSFAGANAGKMYGAGLYFAENSSKSDEYASDDKDGIYRNLFCLLICRVTIGETLHMTTGGEKTHKMIDASMESEQYDSVLGDRQASVGTYREFIVYEEDQVYPEYLILYKRDSS